MGPTGSQVPHRQAPKATRSVDQQLTLGACIQRPEGVPRPTPQGKALPAATRVLRERIGELFTGRAVVNFATEEAAVQAWEREVTAEGKPVEVRWGGVRSVSRLHQRGMHEVVPARDPPKSWPWFLVVVGGSPC